MWISNAGFCNLFIVFARIEDDKNITGFIVENDPSNGISLGDEEHKLGIRSSSTRQVFFNETKVPVENMLAGRGEGFKIAMKEASIKVIETGVGDRYVLEAMEEKNYVLGGEQSGHVILRQLANTGDGLLTALQLMQEVVRAGKTLQELAATMVRFPQVLINVPGVDKTKVRTDEELNQLVATAEAELGDNGRVLLRASGTEALVRVMVEAQDQGTAQSWAERIALAVERRLGL